MYVVNMAKEIKSTETKLDEKEVVIVETTVACESCGKTIYQRELCECQKQADWSPKKTAKP